MQGRDAWGRVGAGTLALKSSQPQLRQLHPTPPQSFMVVVVSNSPNPPNSHNFTNSPNSRLNTPGGSPHDTPWVPVGTPSSVGPPTKQHPVGPRQEHPHPHGSPSARPASVGPPHANRCSVVPRGLPAARLPSVALPRELQQSSPAQELASGPRHLECCLKAAALALLWRPDHCRRRACLGVRPMS